MKITQQMVSEMNALDFRTLEMMVENRRRLMNLPSNIEAAHLTREEQDLISTRSVDVIKAIRNRTGMSLRHCRDVVQAYKGNLQHLHTPNIAEL